MRSRDRLTIESAELGAEDRLDIRYRAGATKGRIRIFPSALCLENGALYLRRGKARRGDFFGKLWPEDTKRLEALGVTGAKPKEKPEELSRHQRRASESAQNAANRRKARLAAEDALLCQRLPDDEREAMPEALEAAQKPEVHETVPEVTPEPVEAPSASEIAPIDSESGTLEVARWCKAYQLPAFVVGRWVWITFEAKPAAELRVALKSAGFRWVEKRGSWAHRCGGEHSTEAKSYAPWDRYGRQRVEEIA